MKHLTFLTLILLTLVSCRNNENKGTITGYVTDSIFLYKTNSESTYALTPFKSIPVKNGKFSFNNDSIELGLYCLSLQNTARGESPEDYAFLFMEPVQMDITISREKNNSMHVYALGSAIEENRLAFTKARLEEENRLKYDSLENLFHKAREMGDTVEQNRIYELSIPYYHQAREKLSELIDTQIEKYGESYFAFYLYYIYLFEEENLDTADEIESVRAYINGFDETCRQSSYHEEMEKMLDRFEKCTVGCEAPDITGSDPDGKPVSLSSLRGKYVLVDFWSSSCTWCRLETPDMQKTYEKFKDRDFTIFGVSFDHKKDSWLKAIEEDKSYWNQVLLSKGDINPTMENYCISGIPHILLLDPEGIILAKNLRGEDIYSSVKKYIDPDH